MTLVTDTVEYTIYFESAALLELKSLVQYSAYLFDFAIVEKKSASLLATGNKDCHKIGFVIIESYKKNLVSTFPMCVLKTLVHILDFRVDIIRMVIF